MSQKVSLLLRIDPNLSDSLRRAAAANNRSVDDLIAEAIREWFANHPEESGLSENERAYQQSLADFDALYRRLKK